MYFLWVYLIITFTFRKCHKDTLSVKRLWVPFSTKKPTTFLHQTQPLYTLYILPAFYILFLCIIYYFPFYSIYKLPVSASPANIRFNYVDYETVLQHIQAVGFPI